MKFELLEPEPEMAFSAYGCMPGGGYSERVSLPVNRLHCRNLPDDLDAIIVTSDLQYYDRRDVDVEERVLMGYVVAQEMAGLGEVGMFPPPERTGVILAGDYYAEAGLDRRGGSGDVEGIWKAFADRFRWVVGVAGNHDLFDGRGDSFGNAFRGYSNVFPLHGDRVEVDGLKFGGVSGIVGDPKKPWRNPVPEYSALLDRVLEEPIDVLLLHSGPAVRTLGLRGDTLVNGLLGRAGCLPGNLICGHKHWDVPLAELDEGLPAINVDSRVILLVRG